MSIGDSIQRAMDGSEELNEADRNIGNFTTSLLYECKEQYPMDGDKVLGLAKSLNNAVSYRARLISDIVRCFAKAEGKE